VARLFLDKQKYRMYFKYLEINLAFFPNNRYDRAYYHSDKKLTAIKYSSSTSVSVHICKLFILYILYMDSLCITYRTVAHAQLTLLDHKKLIIFLLTKHISS